MPSAKACSLLTLLVLGKEGAGINIWVLWERRALGMLLSNTKQNNPDDT